MWYFPITDLIFSDGVDVNTIKISLVPDNLPEGPESFLVNLTSIELLQPLWVSTRLPLPTQIPPTTHPLKNKDPIHWFSRWNLFIWKSEIFVHEIPSKKCVCHGPCLDFFINNSVINYAESLILGWNLSNYLTVIVIDCILWAINNLMFSIFSNNDYTIRGGLQLDMPPVIGQFSVKTVTIQANDNAEGIIEFAKSSVFECKISKQSHKVVKNNNLLSRDKPRLAKTSCQPKCLVMFIGCKLIGRGLPFEKH